MLKWSVEVAVTISLGRVFHSLIFPGINGTSKTYLQPISLSIDLSMVDKTSRAVALKPDKSPSLLV